MAVDALPFAVADGLGAGAFLASRAANVLAWPRE